MNLITNSREPMTIKNGSLQYVAVNQAFLRLLSLPHDYPILGKTLDQLPTSLAYLSNRIHKQEELVMQHEEKFSSIVTHPVGDNNSLHALCFDSRPYYDDDGICAGTMLQVRPVDIFSPDSLLEGDVPKSLVYQVPSRIFTNAEWEAVFLISLKYSRKAMSRELGTSLKAVEHRISRCLEKTGTTTGDELLEFCRRYNWDMYVPPRFLKPRFRLFKASTAMYSVDSSFRKQ
ncbi:helix-turn-helix transcriptional regulator [Leclercia adecarboxylata]|uniref:helix-turn-helix transcriptional regulator n=1 Tax=Leclercia adecarboxylata TaxID=83655 RepID=UPI0023DD2BEE|nr:PAS domain-containing protein [Leclercia adecarboxylata]